MNEPLLITANLLKDIKKCSAKVNYSLTYNGISIQQQLNPSTFYSPLLRRSALMQKINSAVVFGAQINTGGSTAQVNSDWNATSGVAEILNKPNIPAAQIQSDWNQSDNASLDYIKNKPTISQQNIKQSEWVSLVLMYQGFAPQGSAESDAVWTIYKIVTLATGGVVSNTEFTNKKWTERNLL